MIVFKVSDVKQFMSALLKDDIFNNFELRSGEISSIAKFQINGTLDKFFLDEGSEEVRNFCLWSEIKPFVLGIIKGGKKPKHLKLTLAPSEKNTLILHQNAKTMTLNIIFENEEVLCTTATTEREFKMDKTVDLAWEEYIFKFFAKHKILISTQVD